MDLSRSTLVDGLIAAIVPAIAYWLAFLFELGYCRYFGIPTEFIDVSLLSVLFALVGLVSLGVGSLIFYELVIREFLEMFHFQIRMRLVRLGFAFVPMLGFALVTNMDAKSFVIVAAIVLVPLFIAQFLVPLVSERGIDGYIAKLEANNDKDFKRDTSFDKLARIVGTKIYLLIGVFAIASFGAYIAGAFDAKTRSSFAVINNYVVIKAFDDHLVLAEFDRASKVIFRKFKVVSIDEPSLTISSEDLGALSPRD